MRRNRERELSSKHSETLDLMLKMCPISLFQNVKEAFIKTQLFQDEKVFPHLSRNLCFGCSMLNQSKFLYLDVLGTKTVTCKAVLMGLIIQKNLEMFVIVYFEILYHQINK